MNNHILNPDTQAAMLLCGHLGQPAETGMRPLTLSEYNRLVSYLLQKDMRPSDLLDPSRLDEISDFSHKNITPERIAQLLARGMSLAFAVEEWTNKSIWILGRSDEDYPHRLKSRLHGSAPVILYGAGNRELLNSGGLAIVGSRDVDEDGLEFTRHVSFVCAGQGITVVSGGARGVDQESMFAALSEGGNVIGVMANSLSKTAVSRKYRNAIKSGNLLLISPFDPEAGFSVGNLMGRNRYIYTLADHALIISSSADKGGTWSGATENLKKKWVPRFVRSGDSVPEGNRALIEAGGIPMDREATIPESKFREWMEDCSKEYYKQIETEEPEAEETDKSGISTVSDKPGKFDKSSKSSKPRKSDKAAGSVKSPVKKKKTDSNELMLQFDEEIKPDKKEEIKEKSKSGKMTETKPDKAEQLSLPLVME